MNETETLKLCANLAAQTINTILLLIERQPDKLQEHLQALREVADGLHHIAR